MIRDLADFDDGATLAADVCIVCGGAVGITIARALFGTRGSRRSEVTIATKFGIEPPRRTIHVETMRPYRSRNERSINGTAT